MLSISAPSCSHGCLNSNTFPPFTTLPLSSSPICSFPISSRKWAHTAHLLRRSAASCSASRHQQQEKPSKRRSPSAKKKRPPPQKQAPRDDDDEEEDEADDEGVRSDHPSPLPKPPAGFILDPHGRVLLASSKRIATIVRICAILDR